MKVTRDAKDIYEMSLLPQNQKEIPFHSVLQSRATHSATEWIP